MKRARVWFPVSLVALATVSALTTPLPAMAWDSLTVFGDSLSDTGNVGRFTYNSATNPLYDEILARQAGLTLQPSSQGGSNYAAGGAVAVPAINPQFNTQDQVARYLASTNGRADPNGLYIHWIGGNDLAAAVALPPLATTLIDNSAGAAASQVKALLNAGAGTVIVPTVPNVGATPALIEAILQPFSAAAVSAAFQSLDAAATPNSAARQQAIQAAFNQAAGQLSGVPAVRDLIAQQLFAAWQQLSAQAAALTARYNQLEENALANTQGNIVRVDINGLFSEVIDNPAVYGLSNTAGMACPPGTSSVDCTSSTAGFSSQQNYLFADRLHPSPAVHAIIADYIQSILDAPAQVAVLTQAPLAMLHDMHNTLDGHLQQQRKQPAEAGQFTVFGGYAGQHARNKNDVFNDGDTDTANLSVGIGYQLSDNWQAGALLSTASQRQHPSDRYDYRLRGNMVALWSQLQLMDRLWLNADVHYADLDYDAIERRIKLGPATRTEQGSSGGKLIGLRVQTGWDLPLGEVITTGPVASYALDYVQADAYQERGDSSSAMRFSDQTRHSQIGAAGWRIDTQGLWINPWAQVSYNHQFGDTDSAVSAGLKSTRTTFRRTSAGQDKDWVDMAVGANVPLGEAVTAFAAVSTVVGDRDYRDVTWNLGLSARF
ncbi:MULTISPECIES: autotransporter outer membrane beta-barrel domain-containing protein [Pantoea]|uniref:autotransporter outer membrane beta-barrel domain-containing protein n=1 Tax=Pantoea TaxID=53335 RepID=UPI000763128B|nr:MULTISPECIES: autotransporter domain-containing protein [Pantoea]AMB77252.1 autotransporter outer membrane beta-barrel domain-containing protein [Pantoea ananatis]MDF7792336.1 autotransporter domain-containing protein [Pantoea ananatis]MDI3363271.1 autotransporter domain-containing protein [Pantoea sp. V108_6]PQK98253.1 autotransporter domain-containing esterase [Pantoea ananatis]